MKTKTAVIYMNYKKEAYGEIIELDIVGDLNKEMAMAVIERLIENYHNKTDITRLLKHLWK